MVMIRSLVVFAVLALGAVASLPAQTRRDRDAARAAEQIGRDVERSVEQALRVVDRVVGRSVEQTVTQSLRHAERVLDKTFGRDLDRAIDDLVEAALIQSGRPQGQRARPHATDDERFQDGGARIDTTFAFSRSGVVDLTSLAGDIVVTGWNRGEARVRASSERGQLRWRFTSSRLSVETDMYRGRTGATTYEISVPEGVRVIMRSTSGSLTTRGTRGSVDASTNSGDVVVVDAADVDLHSLSGDVTASRLRGQVEATTVNGTVDVQDVEARSIRVESTSGDIMMAGVRSRDVAASTVSGAVMYRGSIESGGQYEFHSHSGNVTLDIPSNVSARFSVETFSGELDAGGFPVTLQPDVNRQRRSSRRLEFTLGGGDARVIAETFSGNVELRRESRR
jgi:DUF4097 and DUF4098 domain-containing protein YvlB